MHLQWGCDSGLRQLQFGNAGPNLWRQRRMERVLGVQRWGRLRRGGRAVVRDQRDQNLQLRVRLGRVHLQYWLLALRRQLSESANRQLQLR
jgi:hypothetical protein